MFRAMFLGRYPYFVQVVEWIRFCLVVFAMIGVYLSLAESWHSAFLSPEMLGLFQYRYLHFFLFVGHALCLFVNLVLFVFFLNRLARGDNSVIEQQGEEFSLTEWEKFYDELGRKSEWNKKETPMGRDPKAVKLYLEGVARSKDRDQDPDFWAQTRRHYDRVPYSKIKGFKQVTTFCLKQERRAKKRVEQGRNTKDASPSPTG